MDNLLNKIHFADCLDILRQLPDVSVDLFLQDPPYGVTSCEWDKPLDLPKMWNELLRVAKPNAPIVFSATYPFANDLVSSGKRYFKYDWIWVKSRGANVMNTSFQPLRIHEQIFVFCKGKPAFNPQKHKYTNPRNRIGQPDYGFNSIRGKSNPTISNGDTIEKIKWVETGERHPLSCIYFQNQHVSGFNGSIPLPTMHPTQKPVDLFRYLIRTYSNPGDVVFDGYGGSGTTAIAAQMEGRKFIVCEKHYPYFEASTVRLQNLISKPYLFSDCG